jgi:NADPH-dependent 2,4-dienoyl-CoA reductase/sulfur reductase-like enzyme
MGLHMNITIIGGDAAGMSAASRIKRNSPDFRVMVLEKTNDVSYSACGMPYNIADPKREIEDLVVRQSNVFREKQGIHLLTDHCAELIDPINKSVLGTTTEGKPFLFPYDHLLIATGASPIIPDLPGFDLPGVLALKSLQDGRRIKEYLSANRVRKVMILGMGYIGLEMCEALRALGLDVEMVKARPGFLPWMEQNMAALVKEEVEANGVRLYPGHAVTGIEKAGTSLRLVCTDLVLEGEMVLVSVGITPNSDLALKAGLELGIGNAISVDRRLRTTNSDIYAAGDCADTFHVVTGRKAYIPLALRANRAGWAVADNICGKEVELQGVAGTEVFKVFELEVARTGLNVKEAIDSGFDAAEVVIQSRSRAHAHPGSTTIWVEMVGDRKSGRVLGAQMVGREGTAAHRINAVSVALHAAMTVDEFSQTDLAYAPPFSPVWDPMLTAANQLLKQM